MTIGVAILGSGIFVREEHLPAVLATPSLSLQAIYSRTSASATKVLSDASVPNAQEISIYSSDSSSPSAQLPALLARSDIQAVIIALPILSQPEYIRAALQAGKHVLSEKPIAGTVKDAQDLVAFHKALGAGAPSWAVAENFRFLPKFLAAAEQVKQLSASSAGEGVKGLLGFRLRMHAYVAPEGKWIDTPWRKVPEYQGGFLLDGGVHSIAALRLVVGASGEKLERVAAYGRQAQKHLPPLDTFDGIARAGNGASGTVSMSFGTTFEGDEIAVATGAGYVKLQGGDLVVKKAGEDKESKVKIEDYSGNGVDLEVKAWAEALEKGKPVATQSPEEALADLELLEGLFKSGEQDGAAVVLKLQV